MKIVVEKGADQLHRAHISTNPKKWDVGKTASEAIMKLIQSNKEIGIDIVFHGDANQNQT